MLTFWSQVLASHVFFKFATLSDLPLKDIVVRSFCRVEIISRVAVEFRDFVFFLNCVGNTNAFKPITVQSILS